MRWGGARDGREARPSLRCVNDDGVHHRRPAEPILPAEQRSCRHRRLAVAVPLARTTAPAAGRWGHVRTTCSAPDNSACCRGSDRTTGWPGAGSSASASVRRSRPAAVDSLAPVRADRRAWPGAGSSAPASAGTSHSAAADSSARAYGRTTASAGAGSLASASVRTWRPRSAERSASVHAGTTVPTAALACDRTTETGAALPCDRSTAAEVAVGIRAVSAGRCAPGWR